MPHDAADTDAEMVARVHCLCPDHRFFFPVDPCSISHHAEKSPIRSVEEEREEEVWRLEGEVAWTWKRENEREREREADKIWLQS